MANTGTHGRRRRAAAREEAARREEEACEKRGVPLHRLHSYQNTATVGFPVEFAKYVDRCWETLSREKSELMPGLLPNTKQSTLAKFWHKLKVCFFRLASCAERASSAEKDFRLASKGQYGRLDA